MPLLTDLMPSDRAIIHQVRGHGALRKRLLDMGVIPGAEIAVVRVAPLGDPVEYLVKGYHLSLRRSEAEQILVHTVTAGYNTRFGPQKNGTQTMERCSRWFLRRKHGR